MKKLLLVMFAVMIALLSISCGGGKSGKVKISYAFWDIVQEPYIKELVKKFQEENPDIEVVTEMTPYAQYFTKLEAAATGGVIADVFWMNMPNVDTYAAGKILQPLDEYIKKDGVNLDFYQEAIAKAYNVDGVQYGMPRDVDSTCVWYNKAIFDKAGVAYPTDNWTWDDMIAKAKEIKQKVSGVYPLVITPNNGFERNYAVNNGALLISDDKKKSGFNSPQVLDAFTKINATIDDGLNLTRDQIGNVNARDLFQSDKIAMLTEGSWWAKAFSENTLVGDHIGVALMPLMNGKRVGYSHGLAISMSSKTKNPEAAWKLIKFLTSKESQEYIARNGVVIPAYKEAQLLWAESKTFEKVDVKAHMRALEGEVVPMAHSKRTQLWDAMAKEQLNPYWAGTTKDLKSILDKISKEMDTILGKN